MKYPIKPEFFPFSIFTPPLNRVTLKMANAVLNPIFWLHDDEYIKVGKHRISGHQGDEIDVFVLEPKRAEADKAAPCLIYLHGGGFVMDAAPSHYVLAKQYAQRLGCKVVFVRYRLAPQFPFPTACEDCFAALKWVIESSKALEIDSARIGVGGDSAGGALAAALALMARDRLSQTLSFQMLIYPVLDYRMNTESNRIYTDTPMWNSRLSEKMWKMYLPDEMAGCVEYASPAEAQSLCELPPAYVELAQFDCLHDEGAEYAQRLSGCAIDVVTEETNGTMHGFDVMVKSPTAQKCIEKRVKFMRRYFPC